MNSRSIEGGQMCIYKDIKRFIAIALASLLVTPALAVPTIIENVRGYTISDGELLHFEALAFDEKAK